MCNKIKIHWTATALVCIPPCICVVSGCHVDVSKKW